MWCEAPALDDGEVTEEHPEIRGWAAAPAGIDRVLVAIDDRPPLVAVHNLARPDLRWCFEAEIAGSCGFLLRLDPDELPPGRHELTVVAVTAEGRAIGTTGAVNRVAYEAPRPGADAPLEETADRERLIPRPQVGIPGNPEHHVRYAWAAQLASGADLLDAGCGAGLGTARLAAQARRAVGIDIAPGVIAEARRDHGDLAEFQEGDLLGIPFADGSFDVVVCFEALAQVREPDRALDELRRVLRPEGLLLVSAPNRGVYPEGNPLHRHEPTSGELRASLEERFANVAIHRQQSYSMSLLGTDAALALDDPAARLDARVAKLSSERPGSELYSVAAASDGQLPPAPSEIAIGGRLDPGQARRLAAAWQERAIKAEVQTAAIRNETFFQAEMQRRTISRLGEELRAATGLAETMRGSTSWRLTSPLRRLGRLLRPGRRTG